MNQRLSILRALGLLWLLLVLCRLALAAGGSQAFPALQRDAMQVRAPEKTVLLAASLAGTRLVAVGERGIVVLSDDHGSHWRQAKKVPVAVTLTAVQFVNANIGWAVGHGGVVLNTEDGGLTWSKLTDGTSLAQLALRNASGGVGQGDAAANARRLQDAQRLVADGPEKPLLAIHFSDAKRGWIAGAYNLFFETQDGGQTWSSAMDRLDNPKSLHLYAIHEVDRTIYLVGEQGLIFRSSDNGRTFQSLASPYKGTWFSIASGVNNALVIAGLRGNAFVSADRGNSWAKIEGAPPASFVGAARDADGRVLLANQAGQILVTEAGAPLTNTKVPTFPPLAGILPLGDGRVLAVGMSGVSLVDFPRADVRGTR